MFIQTEATPNPATLKFIPGRVVSDGTAAPGELGGDPRVVRIAVRDLPGSGKPAELLAAAGIDAEHIIEAAQAVAAARVEQPAGFAEAHSRRGFRHGSGRPGVPLTAS